MSSRDADDAPPLIDAAPAPRPPAPRRRRIWLVVLAVAAPLLLTLAGVITAPPRAAVVPQGRIVFLEADQPSEHTSLLRGLRITLPRGGSRELLHETEPQDVDAGSRDWITQPVVSPNGRWLAYEKQLITLQEEHTGIVNQVWALPLDTPHAAPHLLADLTAQHLKQCIGLAWTPSSQSVVFLNDDGALSVNVQGKPHVEADAITNLLPLTLSPSLSATRNPVVYAPHLVAFGAQTTHGPRLLLLGGSGSRRKIVSQPLPSVWALTPGGRLAALSAVSERSILVGPDLGLAAPSPVIQARWGWSVFGGRRITSLKWSPNGRYLGYTVSKPPFEDELFYADTQTGRCYQLPLRTGRAAWDWTR